MRSGTWEARCSPGRAAAASSARRCRRRRRRNRRTPPRSRPPHRVGQAGGRRVHIGEHDGVGQQGAQRRRQEVAAPPRSRRRATPAAARRSPAGPGAARCPGPTRSSPARQTQRRPLRLRSTPSTGAAPRVRTARRQPSGLRPGLDAEVVVRFDVADGAGFAAHHDGMGDGAMALAAHAAQHRRREVTPVAANITSPPAISSMPNAVRVGDAHARARARSAPRPRISAGPASGRRRSAAPPPPARLRARRRCRRKYPRRYPAAVVAITPADVAIGDQHDARARLAAVGDDSSCRSRSSMQATRSRHVAFLGAGEVAQILLDRGVDIDHAVAAGRRRRRSCPCRCRGHAGNCRVRPARSRPARSGRPWR